MTSYCIGLLFMICNAPPPPAPASTFCQIYEPVYWSSKDTRKTKEQTDRNNARYEKLCLKGARK